MIFFSLMRSHNRCSKCCPSACTHVLKLLSSFIEGHINNILL